MFDGADDLMLCPDLDAQWRRVGRRFAIGALAVFCAAIWAAAAFAQSQPTSCSGTVGGTAANITFTFQPTQYVMICNPSASATLWVSAVGAAAANASGSIGLPTAASAATACLTLPPMPTISIIASAGSTPYTCMFR